MLLEVYLGTRVVAISVIFLAAILKNAPEPVSDQELYAQGKISWFDMKSDLQEIEDQGKKCAEIYRSSASTVECIRCYVQHKKLSMKYNLVVGAKNVNRAATHFFDDYMGNTYVTMAMFEVVFTLSFLFYSSVLFKYSSLGPNVATYADQKAPWIRCMAEAITSKTTCSQPSTAGKLIQSNARHDASVCHDDIIVGPGAAQRQAACEISPRGGRSNMSNSRSSSPIRGSTSRNSSPRRVNTSMDQMPAEVSCKEEGMMDIDGSMCEYVDQGLSRDDEWEGNTPDQIRSHPSTGLRNRMSNPRSLRSALKIKGDASESARYGDEASSINVGHGKGHEGRKEVCAGQEREYAWQRVVPGSVSSGIPVLGKRSRSSPANQ